MAAPSSAQEGRPAGLFRLYADCLRGHGWLRNVSGDYARGFWFTAIPVYLFAAPFAAKLGDLELGPIWSGFLPIAVGGLVAGYLNMRSERLTQSVAGDAESWVLRWKLAVEKTKSRLIEHSSQIRQDLDAVDQGISRVKSRIAEVMTTTRRVEGTIEKLERPSAIRTVRQVDGADFDTLTVSEYIAFHIRLQEVADLCLDIRLLELDRALYPIVWMAEGAVGRISAWASPRQETDHRFIHVLPPRRRHEVAESLLDSLRETRQSIHPVRRLFAQMLGWRTYMRQCAIGVIGGYVMVSSFVIGTIIESGLLPAVVCGLFVGHSTARSAHRKCEEVERIAISESGWDPELDETITDIVDSVRRSAEGADALTARFSCTMSMVEEIADVRRRLSRVAGQLKKGLEGEELVDLLEYVEDIAEHERCMREVTEDSREIAVALRELHSRAEEEIALTNAARDYGMTARRGAASMGRMASH